MLNSSGPSRVWLSVLVSSPLPKLSTCLIPSDWVYSFSPLLLKSPSLGETRLPNSKPSNLWIIYSNTEPLRLLLKRMLSTSLLKRRVLTKALLTQPRVFKIYTTNSLPSSLNRLPLSEKIATLDLSKSLNIFYI